MGIRSTPTRIWRTCIFLLLINGGAYACTTTHRMAVGTQITFAARDSFTLRLTLQCSTCTSLADLSAWGLQWEAHRRMTRSVTATLATRVGRIAEQCTITEIDAIACRAIPPPLTCSARARVICPEYTTCVRNNQRSCR
ncbi:hypothetical protein HYV74_02830 [Candidatus Uhrbacteria bacterium]|nr:hypothetical protein [Candidatus Uhrbacteria bacterium]